MLWFDEGFQGGNGNVGFELDYLVADHPMQMERVLMKDFHERFPAHPLRQYHPASAGDTSAGDDEDPCRGLMSEKITVSGKVGVDDFEGLDIGEENNKHRDLSAGK